MSDRAVPSTNIEVLLAHADWVRRLTTRLVHDQDPQDLAQDAWLAALRSPPREGSARGWLGTVVQNLARKRWRSAEVAQPVPPSG